MDLRIVFVKRSALAHKFEEERLKLAERAAFNGRGNLETSCAVFDCRCPRSREANRQLRCTPSARRFSASNASRLRIDW